MARVGELKLQQKDRVGGRGKGRTALESAAKWPRRKCISGGGGGSQGREGSHNGPQARRLGSTREIAS